MITGKNKRNNNRKWTIYINIYLNIIRKKNKKKKWKKIENDFNIKALVVLKYNIDITD